MNTNGSIMFDQIITDIADYVEDYKIDSDEAMVTAQYCLLDAMGCGILALNEPELRRHIGPVVPGANLPNGSRVPGTEFTLDPVQAAYNIGTMVRWYDYNDTWLAAEWGHPSDNFGAIIACADYANRNYDTKFTVFDVLTAAVKAYEIQGILALENSFNRVGLDHVILVKAASCALATQLLGGNKKTIINALSNAWIDGGALRTYRHAPNVGWRKSWAAADATSRAVRLALMANSGEMGYPGALSTPQWGFYDVLFGGDSFKVSRPYGSYVMENILFKVAVPVEFHAQTAVECAFKLHPRVRDNLDNIDRIVIKTHSAAMRIINKTGLLRNHADRDHSLQYAVAIGFIYGELEVRHFSDKIAENPAIDLLRQKMTVEENPQFSKDYLDPEKRSIANSVTLYLKDGTSEELSIEYPVGHRRRRKEALPLLISKFENNLNTYFTKQKTEELRNLMTDYNRVASMDISVFMEHWQSTYPSRP